ncbi:MULTISPECIES: alkaline phosphatase family protein [unclassified Mesorhizobium]|uniref:alkaline phosphatase family protein n=1 Tax=unclassified Mesorhizobium TaxID=325217 RepID=UPI000FE4A0F1|nr:MULTISPECIES: alkaline phosphatase family protein [unclassified Mesorhizobium]RWB93759.1 MAG: alkaline phosphatase family protein [Mesorhizobium sp.]TGV18167.1 alkaline phosphatase family protein [Mesorhizobium sp. M4B.F.Ca.ET.143.01.1.1]
MAKAKHVIIMGIDGLRPDMVKAEWMPNLAALSARGVVSKQHRTVFPSETRGALTALATGSRPSTNGILGNEFYSRDASGRLTQTDIIHHWRLGEQRLIGGMVTTPSLGETLAKSGKSFAVVTSSGPGSFTALNWKGDALGHVGFNLRYPQIAFPPALAADICALHAVPADGFDRGVQRETVEIFTRTVWPARRPDASIIWITELDSASHCYGLGAPEMLLAMKRCDEAVGDLVDWRDRQPSRDNIAIVITSDHGHSTAGTVFSIDETFKSAGIKAGRAFQDDVDVLYRNGRAPGIWLRKFDKGLLQGVFDVLHEQDWFGATFSRAAEKGTHEGLIPGTLAIELTGTGHMRAPDLYVNLRGDNSRNAHGIPGTSYYETAEVGAPTGLGTHGGLHATELAAVLICEGAGFRRSAEIESRTGIYDIAPTALHLLGIDASPYMTGRILREVLDGETTQVGLVQEEYTSTTGGKTSRLSLTRIGNRHYVDEADLVFESTDGRQKGTPWSTVHAPSDVQPEPV